MINFEGQVGALNIAPIGAIGSACVSNITCMASNGFCDSLKGICVCLPSFFEDSSVKICRIAPGFGEPCGKDSEIAECRTPFVCNSSNVCECPKGYVEEYFQCIKGIFLKKEV